MCVWVGVVIKHTFVDSTLSSVPVFVCVCVCIHVIVCVLVGGCCYITLSLNHLSVTLVRVFWGSLV